MRRGTRRALGLSGLGCHPKLPATTHRRRQALIALSVAVTVTGSAAHAQSIWDAGGGTVSGTFNTGLSQEQTVNFYVWDDTPATAAPGEPADNWDPDGYTRRNAAVFDQASGTFLISPRRVDHDANATTADVGMAPTSMTFDGGATYHFLRSSTTSTSNNASGWANATFGFGVDSFSSLSPFDLSMGTSSINLASTFTGRAILGAQAAAFSGSQGAITIRGGSLEIRHAGALPGISNNSADVTLAGGDFAVNIDQGSYTFRQNNINPSSGQMSGLLDVTENSSLSNNAVEGHGRAREQIRIWNGPISVAAGKILTVNTGGGTRIGENIGGASLSGAGTIRIGTAAANSAGSNRLQIHNNLAVGSTSLHFDTGDTGILQNGVAVNGTTNLGSLTGGAGSYLAGSSQNASATGSSTTSSIGANGASTTFDGTITNGVATNSSGGQPAGTPHLNARTVLLTNLAKTGAGTLTLNGANGYGGANTVSGGTLRLGNAHAIGDGGNDVTVNAGGTLDFNGNSPVAGKPYVLAGGALVNDGATPVTLSDGASGHFVFNSDTTGAGSSGAWTGPGNTPTVTVSPSDTGGTNASAQAILQLGWLRHHVNDGGVTGSGYTKEPIITFSDPDPTIPGARAAKAVAFLGTNGQVAGVTIYDPGYGYTSVPTITIDNTGTGGSGFMPVFSMTLASVRFTDGGSGYTAAPAVTFGGPGYLAGSATGVGGFGHIVVNADSSIGGAGPLDVAAAISGAGGLTKVGAGATTFANDNTYAGDTAVSQGTLALAGGSLGNGNVTVQSLATFAMDGASSLTFNIDGEAPGAFDVFTQETGGLFTLDGTLNADLGATFAEGASWDLFALAAGAADGFDALILSGSYSGALSETTPGLWTGSAGGQDWTFTESTGVLAVVPEPAGLTLLAAGAAAGLLSRRRRHSRR